MTALTNRVVAMNALQYRVFTGQRKFCSIVIEVIDDKRVDVVTRLTIGANTIYRRRPPGPIVDVVMAADALIGEGAIANGCAFSSGKKCLFLLVAIAADGCDMLS